MNLPVVAFDVLTTAEQRFNTLNVVLPKDSGADGFDEPDQA